MIETIYAAMAYLSRVCGFETVDTFPPGHAYARTHWNRAYFDIASDLKPDQIENALCAAIDNTPTIFMHITNPTPRMQRALLALIEARVRRASGDAGQLVALLIAAYRSPYILEALPGLRNAVEQTEHLGMQERVHATLAFLGQMPAPFDIIEAGR